MSSQPDIEEGSGESAPPSNRSNQHLPTHRLDFEALSQLPDETLQRGFCPFSLPFWTGLLGSWVFRI